MINIVIILCHTGPVYPDECDCSKVSIDTWLSDAGCRTDIEQINSDLNQFKKIDFNTVLSKMVQFFSQHSHSMSTCQYVIKNNSVRTCSVFLLS